MNRRSFFKVVTGFVAGIFATSAKSKEDFPIPADPLKDKFVLNHMHVEEFDEKYRLKPSDFMCDDIKGVQEAIDLQDQLLAAIFGPPKCEPCYDDCPHQVRCRWTDAHCTEIAGVDDTKVIQEAIDLAKDGGFVYFPMRTYNIKSTFSCPVHQPRL